jgi:hypothetical protein
LLAIGVICAISVQVALASGCGGDDSDDVAVAYVRQARGVPAPSQVHVRSGGQWLEFELPSLTAALRISPSGDKVFAVTATFDGAALYLWERGDGDAVQRDAFDLQPLTLAEWSPDGSRFVLSFGTYSLLYDSGGNRLGEVMHSSLAFPLAPAWRADSEVFVAGISPTLDIVSRDGVLVSSYDLPRDITAHYLEYAGWTSSQSIVLGWLENRVTSEVSVTVGGSVASAAQVVTVDDLGPRLRFDELHVAILGRFPEAQYLTSQPGSGAGDQQPLLFVTPAGETHTLWLALLDRDEPRFLKLGEAEARSFDVAWQMDAVVLP